MVDLVRFRDGLGRFVFTGDGLVISVQDVFSSDFSGGIEMINGSQTCLLMRKSTTSVV